MKRRPASDDAAVMPDFIAPCLATLKPRPPSGESWTHEIKLDGYRIMARIEAGEVRLLTRKGLDWTSRFAPIAAELKTMRVQRAYLDGEVVVRGDDGLSSFAALVGELGQRRPERMEYMVFDLLYLDGEDLRRLPLAQRKTRLAALLKRHGRLKRVHGLDALNAEGTDVLAAACELDLEGLVSKRLDAPYHSGRQTDWIKAKCFSLDDFVIIGYLPMKGEPDAVGALVVGERQGKALVYRGRVGTGFDHATAAELRRRLDAIRVTRRPVASLPAGASASGVIWVKPVLNARVHFRERTPDGVLRHSVFKGLREDI